MFYWNRGVVRYIKMSFVGCVKNFKKIKNVIGRFFYNLIFWVRFVKGNIGRF